MALLFHLPRRHPSAVSTAVLALFPVLVVAIGVGNDHILLRAFPISFFIYPSVSSSAPATIYPSLFASFVTAYGYRELQHIHPAESRDVGQIFLSRIDVLIPLQDPIVCVRLCPRALPISLLLKPSASSFFCPGESAKQHSASYRRVGTQLRPIHPSPILLSTTIHALPVKQSFHSLVTLHPPQYIDIPFPAQNARAGPAIATIFFYAGSDHVDVDAGVCSATKAYVRFFVFFSFLRHSTIPLAAVWFFTPYSLSPFPASPWRSLSRSPLPPLPFALVVLRYRYQRPCSSPSHWPNVSVITVAGCSDSGLITFVLPLAFLSIPTPVIPLISSRFLPLEHFYDSTPFSPNPMLRTHPPQSPIFPCALVHVLCDRPPCSAPQSGFFFGLDIPLLGMPRYAASHFYLDLCLPSPSRDTIYLLCIPYRASPLVPPGFCHHHTVQLRYENLSLNATALHYSTIESP
ncbi:hypothetical protein B0H13DRAFT_2328489 [Mycena leptocephala]|nr:hypothetical protein B0H13DRAFT_2328489 [Mycena leptocephala]